MCKGFSLRIVDSTGVVPILNSPAGINISGISSLGEVRVAPTPRVGDGTGVVVGLTVGVGEGEGGNEVATMIVGTNVSESVLVGDAATVGAAVGVGGPIYTEQVRVVNANVSTEMLKRLWNLIEFNFIINHCPV